MEGDVKCRPLDPGKYGGRQMTGNAKKCHGQTATSCVLLENRHPSFGSSFFCDF